MNAGRQRVAVAGASGRMGRMLIEAIADSSDLALCGAMDVPDSAAIGSDPLAPLGRRSGIVVTSDPDAALADASVLIDFTRPEGTLRHLAACRAHGCAAVVGTTGLTSAHKAGIAEHAQHIAIVLAPNMSVGVNVALMLVAQAARALDDEWDVEIVEMHHRMKVDAPSGTALQMGEVVARGRGTTLEAADLPARQGETGVRRRGAIGFASLRGGDVVGDHTVVFAGAGERIEITHRSASRAGYADGSLRAARFLRGRAPGLYDMADVLGMKPAATRTSA